MWWFYLLMAVFVLLRMYFRSIYNYWSDRGIPTSSYKYVVGNMGNSLLFRRNLFQIISDIYREFPGYNYVGYYDFQSHGIVLRNPEIIKDILTTNYKSFNDNNAFGDMSHDPLFKKNPFFLKGEEWKEVRNQLTPAFTANKLKAMIPLLAENGKKLVKYLEANPDARSSKGLEAKELCSKLTAENVASCAYGLEGRCFVDEKSEFRENGRRIIEPSLKNAIKILLIQVLPFLTNALKIRFTPEEVANFFKMVIQDTIELRKKNPDLRRNDFIDQMTDLMAKINDESKFNIEDIVIHAGGFFIDGYETSATAICFAYYEIARNQDIQEKLRKEIEDVLEQHKGEITSEALQEMTYLDCVWKETLRLHPPALALVKMCTKDYQLPPLKEDGTGTSLEVKTGTRVAIPVLGLHRDEQLYPDPMRFDPERFSEENKNNINKYAYLPFGEGPRMCLGNKFAILQSKMAILTAVRNFKMTVNSKTIEPIQINPLHFLMAAKGGLWLNFEKI